MKLLKWGPKTHLQLPIIAVGAVGVHFELCFPPQSCDNKCFELIFSCLPFFDFWLYNNEALSQGYFVKEVQYMEYEYFS